MLHDSVHRGVFVCVARVRPPRRQPLQKLNGEFFSEQLVFRLAQRTSIQALTDTSTQDLSSLFLLHLAFLLCTGTTRCTDPVTRSEDRNEHQLWKCRAHGVNKMRVCTSDANRPFGYTMGPCSASETTCSEEVKRNIRDRAKFVQRFVRTVR